MDCIIAMHPMPHLDFWFNSCQYSDIKCDSDLFRDSQHSIRTFCYIVLCIKN